MTLEQTKKFTEQDENTLQYYNQNATKFIENTKSVEFHSVQDKFLSYLSDGSYILDFGCGSGRDSKYFLEKGYRVDAVDGSEEICKITREYVKIEVKTMLFSELSFVNKYEGIWAWTWMWQSWAAASQALPPAAASLRTAVWWLLSRRPTAPSAAAASTPSSTARCRPSGAATPGPASRSTTSSTPTWWRAPTAASAAS